MIHVQYAPVACRAVVTSVWLKHIADQAVPSPLALVISEVEAPERRYLTWITVHCFQKAPHQHQKEYIVHNHERAIVVIWVLCSKKENVKHIPAIIRRYLLSILGAQTNTTVV